MRDAARCRQCGAEVAAGLLACPACGALTHADELNRLAATAAAAPTPSEALASWRDALALLPPESRQHRLIVGKIDELRREVDGERAPVKAAPSQTGRRTGLAGAAVAVLALLAKFKFAIFFLLTKVKFLLLGLSKGGTVLTMLASFGVYWALWGWKFAAGLVGSIYVHEMGHVERLRRYGIPATAPMFIPGFGALIRLRANPQSSIEDARVGLAGPLWGLGAALVCWIAGVATGSAMWLAIAGVGAWINLFNLMPVWQLDGSRAFRALSRLQRWMACASLVVAFLVTHEGLLILLAIVAAVRAIGRDAPAQGDQRTLVDYIFLVATLSALALAQPASQPQ